MSQEDLDLLRAVREWRPPNALHPIAMHAFHLYEDAGLKLTPEVLGKIRGVLDSYGDDLKSLAEAMEGLVRFMVMLTEHRKDEEGGKKVGELLREYAQRFEPFWEQVGKALDNVGTEAREAFAEFTGGLADKSAPGVGERAPEGSVRLAKLVTPARPPPWAKPKGEGEK